MNEALSKRIYMLGCRVRRTPVRSYLEELEESQFWSRDEQRQHQLERLRALIAHAWRHAPFYRERLERSGIDPRGVESLDDLVRLPSVGKRELAAERHTVQNEGLAAGLVRSETSGSTGEPFVFRRDRAWDAQHRAAVVRGYRWYGVEPWMRSGYLWGLPPGGMRRLRTRFEDFLQNRVREKRFDFSDETLEAFCRKLESSRFLEGYSSMVYELARYINERRPGAKPFRLRLVKATSEKIYPHYQREALRAFGRRMTGEYGAAEAGIIAFECPAGTMHVNTDHVIVGVEDGEIVVTNLLSFSFPFIRYRLGDYVTLRDHVECPCGRQGPAVEEVSGRVGRRIYGSRGRFFPSLTIYYVIKSLSERSDVLVRCRALQRERGRLEFLAVLDRNASRRQLSDFRAAFDEIFHGYYGSDVEYRLEFVDDIPREGTKQADFISHVADE